MAIGGIKTEYVFLPPIIFRESLFFFIYLITSRYLSVIMHKLINFGVLYNEGKRSQDPLLTPESSYPHTP